MTPFTITTKDTETDQQKMNKEKILKTMKRCKIKHG